MTDAIEIRPRPALRHERAVGEVVRLDARQGEREATMVRFERRARRRIERRAGRFVTAPGARRRTMVVGIAIGQAAIVVAQKVGALGGRQMLGEVAPCLGEDRAHAVEEPLDLRPRAQEDAAQDEAGDALGMFQAVGQGQRAAPRAAEQQPLMDAEMGPELFHVGHQVAGAVVVQLAERHGAAAAALVEHYDAVELRVEEPAMHGG